MLFCPFYYFLFASFRCMFFFETVPKGHQHLRDLPSLLQLKMVFSEHCSMKHPAEHPVRGLFPKQEALMHLSSCCSGAGMFTSISVLVRYCLLSFAETIVHETAFISQINEIFFVLFRHFKNQHLT